MDGLGHKVHLARLGPGATVVFPAREERMGSLENEAHKDPWGPWVAKENPVTLA